MDGSFKWPVFPHAGGFSLPPSKNPQSGFYTMQGLSFPSDFVLTRQLCKEQKKWLMINIQASIRTASTACRMSVLKDTVLCAWSQ